MTSDKLQKIFDNDPHKLLNRRWKWTVTYTNDYQMSAEHTGGYGMALEHAIQTANNAESFDNYQVKSIEVKEIWPINKQPK